MFLEESQRVLCQKLRECIDSLGRLKRLFIFLNPFGGKKSATKIFLDHVKPLLEDAEIQITVQETKHQLHAKEVAHALDLSKYDGIICVSGDGVLVEVVNGLLEREDWDIAIKMPLGVIPVREMAWQSLFLIQLAILAQQLMLFFPLFEAISDLLIWLPSGKEKPDFSVY